MRISRTRLKPLFYLTAVPYLQALSMYKYWVEADTASGHTLQGSELQECRLVTAAVARFLQYDPDGGCVLSLLLRSDLKQSKKAHSSIADSNPN